MGVGSVRVRWNLDLPATQVVEGAILQIDEGPQHWRLHLGLGSTRRRLASLQTGIGGRDHLEIRGRGAAPLSQTVRVIDGLEPQADLGSTEKAPLRPQRTAKRTEVDHRARSKGSLCLNHVQPGLGRLRNFA